MSEFPSDIVDEQVIKIMRWFKC